jgi:hypothetical protein
MRFKRGTKVRIAWVNHRGQTQSTLRWWSQVDPFIRRFSHEQATDFRVKGHGWADWRRYDPRES